MDFSGPAALQQALSCLGATDTDQVKAAEDAAQMIAVGINQVTAANVAKLSM